ncbi:hypothetical protein NMY22_g2711 [Coprinellus aureogranulatus]|nr:hypothetical protein NMY22_g2711 [Coprinellus aureogranulatus]
MPRALGLTLALLVPLLVASAPANGYGETCSEIASKISSANSVFSPDSQSFQNLTRHWLSSSTQTPACVVEPQNTADVATILEVVGRTRTPFAVQSGGHASNPGWSSTDGVHISMNGFRSIEYNSTEGVVEFGTGLRWGDVYEALEPHNVSVVGGRGVEVGVGGFTLGGGHAWKTNQYGLTIDTAVAFELVKPNGEVVRVTETSEPDLFFGLRGAQNNFGIVTKITLKAVPQGQTWGGIITYADPSVFSAVSAATAKFSEEVTDPKAAVVSTITYTRSTPLINVILFYDGPEAPAGMFDAFLNITSARDTIGTQESLLRFIKNVGDPVDLQGARGRQITIPVPAYSVEILDLINNLTHTAGAELTPKSLAFAAFAAEPFLPSILSHNQSASAYPFDRSKVFTPCALMFAWTDPSQDELFDTTLKNIRDTLESALIEEGHVDIKEAPLYNNYAHWDTPIERLYGSNLPKLKEIKAKVDPDNVMGLAGGFKI